MDSQDTIGVFVGAKLTDRTTGRKLPMVFLSIDEKSDAADTGVQGFFVV